MLQKILLVWGTSVGNGVDFSLVLELGTRRRFFVRSLECYDEVILLLNQLLLVVFW